MNFQKLYDRLKDGSIYTDDTAETLYECVTILSDDYGLSPFHIAQALHNAACDVLVFGDDENKRASIKVLSQGFIEDGKELQAYLRRREYKPIASVKLPNENDHAT